MNVFRDESGVEDLISVSIGLVVKLVWGTKISLDGDGGFRLVDISFLSPGKERERDSVHWSGGQAGPGNQNIF